jgi:GT2 family glycosyltransferase
VTHQPLVSILIPAYGSEQTIHASLRSMMEQTYPHIEIVMVDSSPDNITEDIIRSEFPAVKYQHVPSRLMPHAAQNHGLKFAEGIYLLFATPDIYACPNWVEQLMAVQLSRPGIVTGAILTYEHDWLNMGIHLAKFDMWLPGGPVRPIAIGTGSATLMSRAQFEQVEGFDENYFIGDTALSLKLAHLGIPIWFVPSAIVKHHHIGTWRDLLQEMYNRGHEFGQLRIESGRWSKLRILLFFFISASGLRLPKILGRVLLNVSRAGQLSDYIRTFPVVFSAHIARLAGETRAYWDHLTS